MAKDFFYSKTQVENFFAGMQGEFERKVAEAKNAADRSAAASYVSLGATGDTGVRKITTMPVGTPHTTINWFRRIGNVVYMAFGWKEGPSPNATVITIPEWAAPAASMMTVSTLGASIFVRSHPTSPDIYGYGLKTTTEMQYIEAAWVTNAPFPQELNTSPNVNAPPVSGARDRTAYPEDFGAKGDGVTDDTAALEAWLASDSPSLRMGGGVYRTSRGLTSTIPGRTILSDGGWIKSTALEEPVLTVTGANTRVRLGVDGTNKARVGIMVKAGGCDASGSEVVNCRSTTTAAGGIWAETAFGFRCVGARIERIHSVGNTTIGDGNGAARGIYLGGSGIVASRSSLIADNVISEITGEEGDAIQVLATAAAGKPFGSMLCTVRGNSITNFSRRAIKVQASDVAVINNECVDLGTEVTGSEHAAIYMINQNGGSVIGNRVNAPRFIYGVHVANSGTIPYAERTTVVGNDVTAGGESTMALYVSGMVGAVITGNRTRGGRVGTNVIRALDSTILDNVGSDSPRPMVLSEPLTGSTVKRNTVAGTGEVEGAESILAPSAEAKIYPETAIPNVTSTTIPWGAMDAPWAKMSDGRVTLAPGRYSVTVSVSGTPANPAGDVILTLWQKSRAGGVVRVFRRPVSAVGRIATWDVSATITVGGTGDEVWTTLYQNSGADFPLLTALGYAYFRVDRLD